MQEASDCILTSEIALEKTSNGDMILVDIRTLAEWQETGLPETAYAITMGDDDFMGKVNHLTENNLNKPVAIICAAGGRSARVCSALRSYGYNFIYDVAEGMMGGQHGKGWLAKGLQTVPYTQAA